MNQKKVKALRKGINKIYSKLPEISYVQDELGMVSLGECRRFHYQQAKRFVKGMVS